MASSTISLTATNKIEVHKPLPAKWVEDGIEYDVPVVKGVQVGELQPAPDKR